MGYWNFAMVIAILMSMVAEACAQNDSVQIPNERIEAARVESNYEYNLGRFERLSGPGDYIDVRIAEVLFDSSTHVMTVRGIVQRSELDKSPNDSIVIAVGDLLEVHGDQIGQLRWSSGDTVSHRIDRNGPAMSPEERRMSATKTIEDHLKSNPVTDHVSPYYVRFGNKLYVAKIDHDGKFELRAPVSRSSNLVVTAPHRLTMIYRIGNILM